jgi:hypothetical protein
MTMAVTRRVLAAAIALACAALFCGCGTADDSLLLTSNGSGPQESAAFDPSGPWVLAYKWDCSSVLLRNHSLEAAFTWDTYNNDDGTLTADHPHGQAKGKKGSGTARYSMGGAFHIQITSACDWVGQVKAA